MVRFTGLSKSNETAGPQHGRMKACHYADFIRPNSADRRWKNCKKSLFFHIRLEKKGIAIRLPLYPRFSHFKNITRGAKEK